MNVNISNKFNFSDVLGALNHSGSLAKLTYMNPFGVHSVCMRPTVVHSSMNIRKIKFLNEPHFSSIDS